jgi:hypothetical protein
LSHINAETETKGLMAVGGCRKCAKTFVNRLELIHHFVDHFPSIFYSFETPPTNEPNFLEQLTQFLTTIKANPENAEQHKSAESAPSNIVRTNHVQEESSTQLDTSNTRPDSLSYHM